MAGKLTLSPEIVIPEPSDPTALLLQSTAVQSLSERIRTRAKANAAFVSGSLGAVQTFAREQETVRGNFPGPIPVVYCGEIPSEPEDLEELCESGVAGIVVRASDPDFVEHCTNALGAGMQPIPEVMIAEDQTSDCQAVVEEVCSKLGSDPVCILVTMEQIGEDEGEEAEEEEKDDDDDDDIMAIPMVQVGEVPTPEEESKPAVKITKEVKLPTISSELKQRVPILGSVVATPGENRIGDETRRFKEAGFTGGLLRADCVPGFRMNPDLDMVSMFWSACIGDLKSLKSKSFSFRAKNHMEKNQAQEWAKYQMDVIESGAIGAADHEGEPDVPVDIMNGDYVGF
eukprot:CAMPEP_0194030980 /NCGR_PEP_ID=MMETSP0009_2-20130614/4276_1 /TAXON_ID=210454 /ORGANISM="Grammatophora oceanica, Strain CCMP 410" /LENGTH=342 /DNA_ID=CAMNT_0038671027 /DNA_START=161 /DNA_END=1189 /DNA_ORIENTATION=-